MAVVTLIKLITEWQFGKLQPGDTISQEVTLPDQSGQSGKVLSTNGTTASWQAGGGGGGATDLGIGTRTGSTMEVTSSTGTSATLLQATLTLAGLLSATDKTTLSNLQPIATSGLYSDLTGEPTLLSQFTNDPGFITGITGIMVTAALGYTPYNATNPAGYVTAAGAASVAPVQSVFGRTGAVLAVSGDYTTGTVPDSSGARYVTDNQKDALNAANAPTAGNPVATIADIGTPVTPAALTKSDDTNVTLTLSGTPATALLQGVQITAGWTGTLADGRIASAGTWNAKQNALGFTPEDVANKQTDLTASGTKYPTVNAVNTGLATKQGTITTGTTAQYFKGDLSLGTLDKTAVGLPNVDNTSDVNKPVSTAQAAADALNLKITSNLSDVASFQISRQNIQLYSQVYDAYVALGSTILAEPVIGTIGQVTTSFTLETQSQRSILMYLPKAGTLTGVRWYQITAGDYTASNYNGVGLYSYSGGTWTLQASSTDDGNIWKQGSSTWGTKNFTSAYPAAAGIYAVSILWSRSAQVTAPIIASYVTMRGGIQGLDFTNSAAVLTTLSGRTSLIGSVAASALTMQAAGGVAVYLY